MLCIEFQSKSLLCVVQERSCSRQNKKCVCGIFPQLSVSEDPVIEKSAIPRKEDAMKFLQLFLGASAGTELELSSLQCLFEIPWKCSRLLAAHAVPPAEVSCSFSPPPFLQNPPQNPLGAKLRALPSQIH